MTLLANLLPAATEATGAGAAISSALPWILMLIVGFALVIVEVYLPGFGVPGILGTLLLIGGILLCAKGDVVLSLVLTVIIVMLLCVVLSVSIRSAAKGRLQKSKMVLHEVPTHEVTDNDLTFYVGRAGNTCTVLRPAGIGEFDGVKLNIVSEGEFIPEGERVVVRRVEGNRIVVERAISKGA